MTYDRDMVWEEGNNFKVYDTHDQLVDQKQMFTNAFRHQAN